jgi:Phage gp6-like head-tail connector protein
MSSLRIKTPGMCPAVDLQTLKNQCRVEIDNDDALLTIYSNAAELWVEGYLGISLIKKTYEQRHDWFPLYDSRQNTYVESAGRNPSYYQGLWFADSMKIKTLVSPIVPGTTTIDYTGVDGQPGTQLVANTDFQEDPYSKPSRLLPLSGNWWPWVQFNTANSVVITFEASIADETLIQEAIANDSVDEATARQAAIPGWITVCILRIAADLYERREEVTELNLKEVPFGVQNLLGMFAVNDFCPTVG